jgi:hypothetical protein
MEESKLYTARVQVVEAMEQGLPWHEAAKRAGLQISQSTAYGFVSGCVKGASKRCVKADMDILSNCEARSASGWNRPVDRLLLPRATRSKRSLPNSFPFRSV